jgi:hypothetical protein
MIIFLERATISTIVLEKGYVVAGGELRGEKWVSLKPPFPTPAIQIFPQGHSPGVYVRRG